MEEKINIFQENLVEAIQNLYGPNRKTDFTEDTILGSDINRIRHLFYYLKSEEIVISLNYHTDTYRSRITQVYSVTATLHVPGFEESSHRRCRLRFEVANELYQFEVPILDIGEDSLTVRIPAFIQSAQRRKHPRMTVDDLFMKFIVVYQPLFGKRGLGQVVETRYPRIIGELQKDEPNMDLINRIITAEIMKISPYFEFKIYGESKPASFMETMLLELQKTIFIKDTTNSKHYFEPQSMYGLVNYQKEYVRLLRQNDEEDARKFFDSIRQEDNKNYIMNYVCTPLMIFNRIIGHLHVHSTVLDKVQISFEQAHRIDLLAQLLNYGMSKTVIARSYFRHALTKIVNISLTGILFELNDKVLFDYLTYHDRLKMIIPIRHHTLNMIGGISRYYPTEEGYHIGVEFFTGAPDDFKHLENFFYERSRRSFH